jgi:hypothetical protein
MKPKIFPFIRIMIMAGGLILMAALLFYDPSAQRTHGERRECREIWLDFNMEKEIFSNDTTTILFEI